MVESEPEVAGGRSRSRHPRGLRGGPQLPRARHARSPKAVRRRSSPSRYDTRAARRRASSGQCSTMPTLDDLVNEALRRQPRPAHRAVARATKRARCAATRPRPRAHHQRGWRLHRRRARRRSRTLPGAVARHPKCYDAGFDAFWELDFFGRVRRGARSEQRRARRGRGGAARCAGDRHRRSHAHATSSCAASSSSSKSRAATSRTSSDTLKLAQVRLDAGRGTEFDTARAQAQLPRTLGIDRAARSGGGARRSIASACSSGREPGALRAELSRRRRTCRALPGIAPVGDPSELLRRRPDIRIAERELAGADGARRRRDRGPLPARHVHGQCSGSSRQRFDGLGDAGTDTWLIAPGISWAALDLGHVQARIGARQCAQAKARCSTTSRPSCGRSRRPKTRWSPMPAPATAWCTTEEAVSASRHRRAPGPAAL